MFFNTKFERNGEENIDDKAGQTQTNNADADGDKDWKSESMLSRVIKSAFCLM